MKKIKEALDKLELYITKEDFKGYDPYDTLNAWVPFRWFGRWGEILAIQIQKRNPINIRPLIGLKKYHSTKGMGLLLSGYLNIYIRTKDENLIPKIERIKNWLLDNVDQYNGAICWGYDFPYTERWSKSLKKGWPTIIHHSYIGRSLYSYYQIFGDEKVLKIIKGTEKFVVDCLIKTEYPSGICFSYDPIHIGCCYNANMHAAESLARVYSITKDKKLFDLITGVLDFVTSMQKEDGSWYYSFNKYGEDEKKQIDFHQGFVLESYQEVFKLIGEEKDSWKNAVLKGLAFYKAKQFYANGQSLWRIPLKFPVEIHNQSQGIITFSKLSKYSHEYLPFAEKIANWTIENMQDGKKGFFYYRINKYFTNKISYMRWSQAWMFLAISDLINEVEETNS